MRAVARLQKRDVDAGAQRAGVHGDQYKYCDGDDVKGEIVKSFTVSWSDIPQLDGTCDIYAQLCKVQGEYIWSDQEESDGEEEEEYGKRRGRGQHHATSTILSLEELCAVQSNQKL